MEQLTCRNIDIEQYALAWDSIVQQDNGSLFASKKYLDLMNKELERASSGHLGCFSTEASTETLVGVMPAFVTKNAQGISVANSSPYFGSHGGVYTTLSGASRELCVRSLLRTFVDFCRHEQILLSNVIEPLNTPDSSYYSEELRPWKTEERIGQIIFDIPSSEEALFQLYHQKTRNMVRKAAKSNIDIHEVQKAELEPALDFLWRTHVENLALVSGIAKERKFFERIAEIFTYGNDWLLFEARLQDKTIASLLLFVFNNTVEYYTPVTVEEHRSLQPMSLLIHHVLAQAPARGWKNFNFGGTWKSQDGVYRFKSRWGASDCHYRYSISKYFDPDFPLSALTQDEAFRGFYLFPY